MKAFKQLGLTLLFAIIFISLSVLIDKAFAQQTIMGAQYPDTGVYKPIVVDATGHLELSSSNPAGINVNSGTGLPINSISTGTGQNGLLTATGATSFYYSINGANSSVTQLAGGASFTGTVESALSEPAISVNLSADQNITFYIYQYVDAAGANLIDTWTYVVPAGTGLNISRTLNGNYVRTVATNTSGTLTTTFNLSTAYGAIAGVTQLGNNPSSINEVNGIALSLGANTAANALPVVLATNSYSHISTVATTVVKSGVGNLHAVIINQKGTVASTITMYDNTAASGTVIGILDSLNFEGTNTYDVAFTTGLTIVTTGTVAPDITVSYR